MHVCWFGLIAYAEVWIGDKDYNLNIGKLVLWSNTFLWWCYNVMMWYYECCNFCMWVNDNKVANRQTKVTQKKPFLSKVWFSFQSEIFSSLKLWFWFQKFVFMFQRRKEFRREVLNFRKKISSFFKVGFYIVIVVIRGVWKI